MKYAGGVAFLRMGMLRSSSACIAAISGEGDADGVCGSLPGTGVRGSAPTDAATAASRKVEMKIVRRREESE